MRALEFALTLALALWLSAGAALGQSNRVDDVDISVESPWPDVLARGYAPVFVTLQNNGTDGQRVELTGELDRYTHRELDYGARASVELESGERRTIELLIPAFRVGSTSANVEVRVGRSAGSVSLNFGSGSANPHDRLVAIVAPKPLPAGRKDAIAAGFDVMDDGHSGGQTRVHSSGGVIHTGPSGWHAAELGPGTLTSHVAGWSGVDLVLLDATGGASSLRGLPLRPLVAWARSGGLLVVMGDASALEELPGVVEALDSRLALPPLDVSVDLSAARASMGAGASHWRLGLGAVGLINVDPSTTFPEDVRQSIVQEVQLRFEPRTATGMIGSAHGGAWPGLLEVPGIGEVPVEAFVLFLLVFAVAVGPVNLLLLRKWKKPAMLLVSIPAISAIASIGILAFGILHQGLGLEGALHSFTLLDQRTGRAQTVTRMALHAGLSAGTLRPEAGTVVQPAPYTGDTERELYVLHGNGLELTSGWVPVRQSTNLVLSTDAPARTRVEVRRDGRDLIARNGLDATIETLVVYDGSGQPYLQQTGGSVAPGEEVRLVVGPEPSMPAADLLQRDPSVFDRAVTRRSTWIARVDQNPFVDRLGLEPNLREERSVVQGLLPAEEAQWNR